MSVDSYNPYEKYGVRRAINAAGTLTRVGGSISDPEVFRAMEDASKAFVHISELQQWAGEKIAEATGAEAGLPTAGGSASIMLAAAACIMKGTELEGYEPKGRAVWRHIIQRVPAHTEGLKTKLIVQKMNRCEYDHAVEIAGGRFVEVGDEEGATEEELEEAFDPAETAAYYYTVQPSSRSLPVDTVIEVAHRNGVPVIVDASAELPPKSNLRYYTSKGVDLVIFSGGKTIAGPNNSGLLAGRGDLIKLAHLQSYPFEGVGRVAKMSRETIVGLVTALRIYLERDEGAHFRAWEAKANFMAGELGRLPGVESGVVIATTGEEKTPKFPLVTVRVDEGVCGIGGGELHQQLVDGDPSIEGIYEPYYLLEDYEGILVFNTQYILQGEEQLIIERIKSVLSNAA
ncbi:aminotransferase class V-fold PLP-dependent enzyme [Candidatus Bathyarchaeota archaeon]|nr:aminotransferase class V-fold PLP-dependent enzyme [Candidatus Bathyarchaeota archaeon]